MRIILTRRTILFIKGNALRVRNKEVKMKDIGKITIKNLNVVYGIAMIAVGILFCILRSSFVSAMLTVAGVMLAIVGAINLIGKKWVEGGIEIALGIVVITCGWTVVDIALLVLGIVLCAYAVYMLISQISTFKRANVKDKVFILLNPIILFIIGILFIVAKWYMVDAVFITLGTIAVLQGIALMFKADSVEKYDEKSA